MDRVVCEHGRHRPHERLTHAPGCGCGCGCVLPRGGHPEGLRGPPTPVTEGPDPSAPSPPIARLAPPI